MGVAHGCTRHEAGRGDLLKILLAIEFERPDFGFRILCVCRKECHPRPRPHLPSPPSTSNTSHHVSRSRLVSSLPSPFPSSTWNVGLPVRTEAFGISIPSGSVSNYSFIAIRVDAAIESDSKGISSVKEPPSSNEVSSVCAQPISGNSYFNVWQEGHFYGFY